MARKRANGEGSTYKRRDGRWVAALTLPDGTRKSYYGHTKREVLEALSIAQQQLRENGQLLTSRQTTGDYLAWWLEEVQRPKIRMTTYAVYSRRIERHVIPYVGHIQLVQLQPEDVVRMLGSLRKTGASVCDQRWARLLLAMALKKAAKWGKVSRNVASLVDPPTYTPKEAEVPTLEQARALLALADGTRDHLLWSMALTLGLRAGELTGLRWSDVDLNTRQITVRHTVPGTIRKQGLLLMPPKTVAGYRVLPIPPALARQVTTHRARQNAERLAAGGAWQDLDLVFAQKDGRPMYGDTMRNRLRTLCQHAGVPEFTMHSLRHYCATQLAEQGVPPKTAMELLGHTDIETTLKVYTKVWEHGKRSAVESLDRLLDSLREAS